MVCMICLWAVIGISRRNIVERASPHQSTETGSWLNWTEKFPAQYTTVPPGNSILTNRYSAAECFKNKTQLKDKSLGEERYRAYLIVQKVVEALKGNEVYVLTHRSRGTQVYLCGGCESCYWSNIHCELVLFTFLLVYTRPLDSDAARPDQKIR